MWAEVGERKAGGAHLSRWAMVRTCRANCGAGGVAAEMFKKGDCADKKPRFLFFAPLQRDAHGGISAEKPRNSRKMACNYSSHKAYGGGNKAGECSPYGRNALNINKKGPFKGLLFHLHPKVNAKRWMGKRQKGRDGVEGGKIEVFRCWIMPKQKKEAEASSHEKIEMKK